VRSRRYRRPVSRFLEESVTVEVRFSEVDSMGVVWHGHYLDYFEAGRVALGKRFGIDYATILQEGYVAPLVHAEVDFLRPARFGEVLTVRARLHAEPGARISMTYRITDGDGDVFAEGLTAQAFTDLRGELVLTRPEFYDRWLARWESEFRDA
jgi:acyl-CoA thioester hydrolase